LASLRAVCAYEGTARKAVHTLKFRSGRYVATLIGELLRDCLQARPLRADVVVPVPIAERRLKARGYNQAELLAREVVAVVGGQLAARVLEREERPAQRTLSAAERLENLRGAVHCVQPDAIQHKRVILIDDVATTGATLSACAEVLAEAGAVRVSALVFARDL
jgi:ComF family protein